MEINIKYLSIQNPWWSGQSLKYDPVLEVYQDQGLAYQPKLLNDIVLDQDIIYIIRGPRGAGKTVILKLLIKNLVEKKKVNPQNVFYYSCHNVNSYEQLNELIKVFCRERRNKAANKRLYVFIDEITLVDNWEKGIEYLRKAGLLKNVELFLSGSMLPDFKKNNSSSLRHKSYQEKILHTLTFREFIELLNPQLLTSITGRNLGKDDLEKFDYYLDIYFLTGGFISAISNFKQCGAVKQGVYSNYIYWLIADIAKLGRNLVTFRQVLEKVIFDLGHPLGFKTIARRTKARTHLTASEYVSILERMFALKVVYQADRTGKIAVGKAKKIYFPDPFLFWTFYSYIYGSLSYWQFSRHSLREEKIFSSLVENIVFSHLLKGETFSDWKDKITYWRDNAKKIEINFLVRQPDKITPILVRYQQKITRQDEKIFAQARFSEGIIISKDKLDLSGKIKIMPLSYFLLFY